MVIRIMEQGCQRNDQGITVLLLFRNQKRIPVDAQGMPCIMSAGVGPEQFLNIINCIFYELFCEASHDLSRVLPTACLAAGPPFGVRTAFPLYSLGSAVTLPQQ